MGFPCGSEGKESAYIAGNPGSLRSLGQKDPLEKCKATYYSSLARRIPQTEELGRLQFM